MTTEFLLLLIEVFMARRSSGGLFSFSPTASHTSTASMYARGLQPILGTHEAPLRECQAYE